MNFLPQEEIKKESQRHIYYLIWIMMIIQIPIFISVVWYKPYMTIQEKQKQLQNLNQQLENPNYQVVLEKLNLLEQVSQSSKQTKKPQWITKSFIQYLFNSLPKDTNIERLDMIEEQNQHQIILQGHAKEALVILNYQQVLEQAFGIGYVTSLFEPDQDTYLYEMTINLDGESIL